MCAVPYLIMRQNIFHASIYELNSQMITILWMHRPMHRLKFSARCDNVISCYWCNKQNLQATLQLARNTCIYMYTNTHTVSNSYSWLVSKFELCVFLATNNMFMVKMCVLLLLPGTQWWAGFPQTVPCAVAEELPLYQCRSPLNLPVTMQRQ